MLKHNYYGNCGQEIFSNLPLVLQRFLSYTQYDTTSDPASTTAPSTEAQMAYAHLLKAEFESVGLTDVRVTDKGIVMATLPASVGLEGLPAMGLIAHMDTSPEASGKPAQWKLLNYQGGDIVLNETQNIVMSLERFPGIAKYAGEQLVVTDGTNCLKLAPSFKNDATMSLFSCPTIEPKTNRISLSDPCFISDLHLNADSRVQPEFFVRFLNEVAQKHTELVILGDFFDYWVGDDAWESAASVLEPLKKWATDKKLYLMHGNRDFMMGKNLADRLGATLLMDPTVAEIGSHRVLLSHGDIWCTNDHDYQKVRRKVRSFWWQWMVLRLSLQKRLQIAHDARSRSKMSKVKKNASLMDVDRETVELAAKSVKCDMIIHGHTHRPGSYEVNGGLIRYVLPDWKLEAANTLSGGYIIFQNDKPLQQAFL